MNGWLAAQGSVAEERASTPMEVPTLSRSARAAERQSISVRRWITLSTAPRWTISAHRQISIQRTPSAAPRSRISWCGLVLSMRTVFGV